MKSDAVLHKIALSAVEGIGPATARRLIDAFGSASGVFDARPADWSAVDGVAPRVVEQILSRSVLAEAEKEVRFVEENNIRVAFIGEENYPVRLRQCPDAPVILYMKGDFNPNQRRILGVVGTRNATSYGKDICKRIVEEMAGENILVVSGMAYGIDYCAHKAALDAGLPTVAVFAHGLDTIYPSTHRKTAEAMLVNGGWVSEFRSQTQMDRHFFPRRNRIVAGLCDGVLVVESDKKGGSLITADIANSYSREVMAIPGKASDLRSKGCNWLIKTDRAVLVENSADILKQLNWDPASNPNKAVQLEVFPSLSDEALSLARCLQQSGPVSIDSLADIVGKPVRVVSAILLNLEMEGVVKALPGKRFRIQSTRGVY